MYFLNIPDVYKRQVLDCLFFVLSLSLPNSYPSVKYCTYFPWFWFPEVAFQGFAAFQKTVLHYLKIIYSSKSLLPCIPQFELILGL